MITDNTVLILGAGSNVPYGFPTMSQLRTYIIKNVRARMRITVKKLLRKYNYPPDKQAIATETVLKQAELFTADWITNS